MDTTPEIQAEDVSSHLAANLPILDVRRTDEYAAGHLDGAINIPHTRLMEHIEALPHGDAPILVHCLAGVRSATACSALERLGKHVVNLAGGWAALQNTRAVAEKPTR